MTYRNFNRLSRQRIVATQHFYRSVFDPCLEFSTVKSVARGRWLELLAELGIPVETLRNQHGPCPGCGGVDRFRFDDRDGDGTFYCSGGGNDPVAGDGFKLLEHVHGWRPIEALRAVAEALGLVAGHCTSMAVPAKSMATATASPIDVEKTRTRLNVLWTPTIPLNHASAEPARRYLVQRGLADLLQDPPPVWRFHPALEYWQTTDGQTKLVGCFPALVAKIQSPTGTPVGLHQTYLTPLGDKANVPEVRKSRSLYKGALRGAAIRLYPATERLVVGEGIETALSVRIALPDWPCWSCLSASGLVNVQIPPGVGEVLIAADADPAGESAAEKLADRLTVAGKTVRVLQPDAGQDWNDSFIRSIRHE